MAAPPKQIDRTVSSLDRGLSIFDAFLTGPDELSLGELEERTKLFKSVILRYMLSFEAQGYIRRNAAGKYTLGPTLFRLGKRYEHLLNIEDVILPELKTLSQASSETAFLSVQEDGQRLCVIRVDSPHSLRVSITPGSMRALDASATAQVLRDFQNGPAQGDMTRCSDGVGDPLTASLSMPVFGLDNALVGALTISGPTYRFDNRDPALVDLICQSAQRASETLGATLP